METAERKQVSRETDVAALYEQIKTALWNAILDEGDKTEGGLEVAYDRDILYSVDVMSRAMGAPLLELPFINDVIDDEWKALRTDPNAAPKFFLRYRAAERVVAVVAAFKWRGYLRRNDWQNADSTQ